MTVAAQITRLQGAKAALKTSIEAKGVTVPSATLISGYASLVDQIQGGGIPDSDGLIDLEIANGDTSGLSSFTLSYFPKYLLKYTPSSSVSTVGWFTIPQTEVTYPNVVWSCNKPSLTISGNTVTVPTGFDSSVTFTATWTNNEGYTRTTNKTINVVNMRPVWIVVTSWSGSGEYFVTSQWPTSIGVTSYETYRDYFICYANERYYDVGWGFRVLSQDGSTMAKYATVAAAKAAIDAI